MANPPVYELVDSSGTVVGELNQEVANNLLRISNEQTNTEIQVKNGEVDYQSNDINNVDSVDSTSVTADDINVTNLQSRSSYSDETANRSLGTQYTNNTNSDLNLRITFNSGANGTDVKLNLFVDGDPVTQFRRILDNGEKGHVSATVPAGKTYEARVTVGGANTGLSFWYEQS